MDASLNDGSIVIVNTPAVDVTNAREVLTPSNTTDAGGLKRIRTASSDEANDYEFILVREMGTLTMSNGYEVQATDVKLSDDGYAFVSYNDEGPAHRGGVVIYKFNVVHGSRESTDVEVEVVTSVQFPNSEISALQYANGKLYMIGASSEKNWGYRGGFDYAFLLIMELNEDKTFNTSATPKVVKLTSFQGTSISVRGDRIFVTTGDGTNGTRGGLFIFNETNYSCVDFIEMTHARSVVTDNTNVFVMQSEPARVTKFDFNGSGMTSIYPPTFDLEDYTYQNEAMQKDAKSEMLVWNNLLFVAMNESGLRMLDRQGNILQVLERPGEDPEKHVTNSVSINTDSKKTMSGKEIQSNLLLVANGEKGMYWYDVMEFGGSQRIFASASNSVLSGMGSTNFISSFGNVAFVANGLGGLKVLYIGFDDTKEDEIVEPPCVGWSFGGNNQTFLKDNGNSKLDPPLDRKVGDILIQTEGDNFVVYLWGTVPNYKLDRSGVIFGSSLEYFDSLDGLLTGGPTLKDKNINNGFMTNRNSSYRTVYSDGSVRFTFPKEEVEKQINENGELLIIIYSGHNSWGYGNPQGPSGQTGTGVNNNGQIIMLKGVYFCE